MEQKDIGKHLYAEFPDYYENSESGAVVNHGTNVRTILIGKGKRWADITGFSEELDGYKDRTVADCESAYQSLVEKMSDEHRERVESRISGGSTGTDE